MLAPNFDIIFGYFTKFTFGYEMGSYSIEQFRSYESLKFGTPNAKFIFIHCKIGCNVDKFLNITLFFLSDNQEAMCWVAPAERV